MNFDIVGVAEHHLDVPSAAEEAGRLRMEEYCSISTPADPTGTWRNHWANRYLEGYGDVVEPLKRWDWTPILEHLKGLNLAMVFAYLCTGDDADAANQVKMAQNLEFTHSIRTPFVIAADGA